jgi:LmbE family N-acetylglucosaminyl deacetylase
MGAREQLMTTPLRLMCVLAHPDDESLGTGGALARYAAAGVETYLVTATRGERGWSGDPADHPGLAALGRRREAELRAAAAVLGLRRVDFLDYVDGDLDRADPAEAIGKLVAHLRRVRPQVVVTFGPEGGYGHPDHIAIAQLATAAVVAAADAGYAPAGADPPHRVAKLYYKLWTAAEVAFHESLIGPTAMVIDGVERREVGWPDWAITTWVDATDVWRTVLAAVRCHQSQVPERLLASLSEAQHRQLWGTQGFYRAFSLVNGGRAREHDLFEGLR